MRQLLILSISLLLFACKTETKESGNKLLIAYNVLENADTDDYEIYTMNLDGSDSINISNHPGVDWVYEAYDDKLFVISDRDTCHRCFFLYETDSKGSYWHKISKQLIADSWVGQRKQGQEFVVKPADILAQAFYIINRDGQLLRTVSYSLPYANDCAFSPDGSQIVFRGGLTESKKVAGHNDELYIINDNGTGMRKLTDYPESDTLSDWWEYRAAPPRWRSDSLITYTSVQKGKSQLLQHNLNSGKTKKIHTGNMEPIWHDVSADGNYIVYDGSINFKADKGYYYINIINQEKRNSDMISPGKVVHQAPVFVRAK